MLSTTTMMVMMMMTIVMTVVAVGLAGWQAGTTDRQKSVFWYGWCVGFGVDAATRNAGDVMIMKKKATAKLRVHNLAYATS